MLLSLSMLPNSLVALIIFIIFALDHPFNGATRVESRPFRDLPESIRSGSLMAPDV